jgi:hypothetical protein
MGEGIKIDTEGEYGLRGEEVKAGYERLHPTEPEPAPLAEDDSLDDMKAVAEQLAERWRSEGRSPTGEQPLIDRGYVDVATGERTAPNKVVSEKEFARDLAKVHQDEAEAAQQQHDAELANQIDNARIEFNLNNNPELRAQLEAAQQQQTQPQQPAQQPAQQSGIHPDVEAALQNQHVRQAIEAELAQVEQARQQYAAVTMQNVQVAAANLFASYPELRGLAPNQFDTALHVIQQRDPARHVEIATHIHQVAQIYQAAQQAQHQAAQIQRARFDDYAKQQDKLFDDTAEKEYGKDRVKAAKQAIVEIARDDYGISQEEMAHLWQTQPILRTSNFQRMMLDAALYRMAHKTALANPASRTNVPPVQRPGAGGMVHSSSDDGEVARLTQRANRTGSMKDVAALRLAKMRAQRG